MIRGVKGIRAPAEEGSVSDGTILKLVLSFENFLNIILPDLKEGARPSWFCGEAACWTACRSSLSSSSEQQPFMTKQCKMAAPEPCERILPGFPLVGYTCSLFNCSGTLSPVFFCYFYLGSFSCSPRSSSFIVGHSSMYNS